MKHARTTPPIDLLRGSLMRFRRKCGGKNCRCQRGQLHESWALSYSTSGRTHLISLRDEDVEVVQSALDRYRVAREELEQRALTGLAGLQGWLTTRRQAR